MNPDSRRLADFFHWLEMNIYSLVFHLCLLRALNFRLKEMGRPLVTTGYQTECRD